ncbi:MAG: RNA 2',3'-cyclic phosphodiesterase [Actinobacteria bacterium]|nr:RNA 2',3'-cyclic phosphodiesterase [Actinomycetota bacterium]
MTGPSLRLFIAVAVPKEVLDALEEATAPLHRRFHGARWMEPSSQHLTLKFLGATAAEGLPGVEEVVRAVAAAQPKARVRLAGMDAFPSVSRARVLWAGADDPRSALGDLANGLNRAFRPLGYAAEKRPYSPHVTVARFKAPAAIEGALPALDGLEGFEVEGAGLYRSHLSSRGARYELLKTFSLKDR